MARRVLMGLTFAAVALSLTACGTSHTAAHPTNMGMMSPEGQVLTLGAGDSLGRAVYVNDLILAAAAYEPTTAYTNVDPQSLWFSPQD